MAAETQGEVHTRRLRGELVVNPDDLERFLDRSDLRPPHGYDTRPVEVEVRTASPDENPPNGAVWFTAVDAEVSLKADPAEVVRVLKEAGLLDRLRADGVL